MFILRHINFAHVILTPSSYVHKTNMLRNRLHSTFIRGADWLVQPFVVIIRGKVVAKNSIADASLIKSEPHWHGDLLEVMFVVKMANSVVYYFSILPDTYYN